MIQHPKYTADCKNVTSDAWHSCAASQTTCVSCLQPHLLQQMLPCLLRYDACVLQVHNTVVMLQAFVH